jgi:hypothetical protein
MEYNVNDVQNKIVPYNNRESLGDTKQRRGMLRMLSNIAKLLRDVGNFFWATRDIRMTSRDDRM